MSNWRFNQKAGMRAFNKDLRYHPQFVRSFMESRVTKNEDGCWDWNGAVNHFGYGTQSWRGRIMPAHRLLYMLTHGVSISKVLEVCHSCDRPICVNPDHMWLGTHHENLRDASLKGRMASLPGEDSPVAKLSNADVIEIRRLFDTGDFTKAALGKMFDCTAMNILHIVKRQSWTHI